MDTVVIVDDSASFRQQLRALLEAGGLVVVGEAGDVASGLAAVRRLRPTVAVVDVGLPDGDGFELADAVAHGASTGDVAVILTSSRDVATYRLRLAASPAIAFVPKDELSADALHHALQSGEASE